MAASTNALEAAAAAAMAAAENFPVCLDRRDSLRPKYHDVSVCLTKPSRPPEGHDERRSIYNKLRMGGTGAALVPNTRTVTCPLDIQLESLESPASVKGFDTTWIVENTSVKPVVLAWIINGIEYSPFTPDLKPMEDPKAFLIPGGWTSVPTFESFVYHVIEINEDGTRGDVVLQHRAGMIPLGKAARNSNTKQIDPEPFSPGSVNAPKPQEQEVGRQGTRDRPCNIIDMGFRNEAGVPLSVYYANNMMEVPDVGFNCAEEYHFHMGLKAAPQDFMWDWSSQTKYEGSYIGDTFVARRADDPSIVVDTYTLEPTRIIDCPKQKKKQVVTTSLKQEVTAGVQNAESCPSDANANGNNVEDINVNVNMDVNMINRDHGLMSNGGGVSSRAAAAGISGSSR